MNPNVVLLKLSVIIVNYRVKYFLEQCLCSVRKAMKTMEGGEVEVIVIDNHSEDGIQEYLGPRFPWVQFIFNKENRGFSAANNQGMGLAKGKNILFLNPDTILPEDCLEKCLTFLESLTGAGACGVRMIDGSGRYLRESKRGFPGPWVSFCKLSGLTAIFPKSKIFAQYYLGQLNEKENHQVDILSGAFIMIKKEALLKTGGFDERFFMYAEDIDLSYRIQEAGFKNYYFASTTIIHFKGESSPKDFRNLKLFYKAMAQFTAKHFRGYAGGSMVFLMNSAIWASAGLSALSQIINRDTKPASSQLRGFYLTGDPDSCAGLRTILISKKKIVVSNPKDAEEIIFCEGPAWPFKRIINSLLPGANQVSYKFHATGSRSIVGSDSKNKMGEVLIIDS